MPLMQNDHGAGPAAREIAPDAFEADILTHGPLLPDCWSCWPGVRSLLAAPRGAPRVVEVTDDQVAELLARGNEQRAAARAKFEVAYA